MTRRVSSRFRSTILLASLVAWTFAPAAWAQSFRIFQKQISDAEGQKINACIVLVGSNQFSFLPPAGWQVKGDEYEKTVTLRSSDQGASIILKLGAETLNVETNRSIETLRQLARQRFPQSVISAEFSCFAAGMEQPVFDLERMVRNLRLMTRVTYLQLPGRTIEVSLTAMRPKFASYQSVFNTVLTSLRVEARRPGN